MKLPPQRRYPPEEGVERKAVWAVQACLHLGKGFYIYIAPPPVCILLCVVHTRYKNQTMRRQKGDLLLERRVCAMYYHGMCVMCAVTINDLPRYVCGVRDKEGGEEKKNVGGEEEKRKGEGENSEKLYIMKLSKFTKAPTVGLSVLCNRATLETALILSPHSMQRKAASHCGNSSPATRPLSSPPAVCVPTLQCRPRSPA